jgi:hypothetical protein
MPPRVAAGSQAHGANATTTAVQALARVVLSVLPRQMRIAWLSAQQLLTFVQAIMVASGRFLHGTVAARLVALGCKHECSGAHLATPQIVRTKHPLFPGAVTIRQAALGTQVHGQRAPTNVGMESQLALSNVQGLLRKIAPASAHRQRSPAGAEILVCGMLDHGRPAVWNVGLECRRVRSNAHRVM